MDQKSRDELKVIEEVNKDRSKLQKTKEETELFDFDEENKRAKNKHKHRIFIGSLYFLWGTAIVVVLIRVYHFLAPTSLYWLDADQIQALDKLVFSGTIGALLGRYGNKLLE